MTVSEFWSSVRKALRGTRQDFAEVPIHRAILLLAVPMILEMAMESLFAIVDIFWVSRLGAEAVASVGLTEAMFTLINLFCYWLLLQPLAYALAHWLRWGPGGVFTAITIAWSTYAVVGAVIFKHGRWKLKRV